MEPFCRTRQDGLFPILLTSTRSRLDVLSAPAKHELLTNCTRPPFCWRYQYGARHPGDVTAMVCRSEIFEPVTLFLGPKRGSPSKIFTPRNILGLPNPHRGRRRGAVPFRRRGRTGRRQAGPVPGRRWAVPRAGRGPQQAAGAERKGGRGIDKASSSLAYGYTAKSICRSGKESDPSGSGPRWAGFGPFGGRGWC